MKQTPATDLFNAQVFECIPVSATKILEIGTGSGSLAAAVKQRNAAVDYVGVEISPEYVELSRKRCDRVYLDNFEKPDYKLVQEIADKDCIVFSDVLEHFVDPWRVLEMLKSTMKPKARIIASIPNVQHWSIQVRLNRGDWRYAESGLLDKTHVRFFTRETILELFETTGFRVIHLEPRIFNFPNQELALDVIAKFTHLLGGNEQTARSDAVAFQFTVVAELV
jgi:2-polyprenyl-3-methyl-5-hydroxy-6-metoxy-1,4-benzoquinol methylase